MIQRCGSEGSDPEMAEVTTGTMNPAEELKPLARPSMVPAKAGAMSIWFTCAPNLKPLKLKPKRQTS